ncbi:hypothetical protein AACH06_24860 [Ideonella sp. DXS29W]|uniref:Uncharacterized protein n=1 Tax=Ideonella lacteola TaxID=2984193 RepID=A0ABU9BXC5_9BURK
MSAGAIAGLAASPPGSWAVGTLVSLARLPWPAVIVLGGLMLLLGAGLAMNPRLPSLWRRCAGLSASLLIAALAMRIGYLLQAVAPGIPELAWGLSALAVGLAARWITGPLRLALMLWSLLCGGVLLVMFEAWLGLNLVLNGLLVLLSVSAFVIAFSKAWPKLPGSDSVADPVAGPAPDAPTPPLIQRLDSDEAQEAADKYTRE